MSPGMLRRDISRRFIIIIINNKRCWTAFCKQKLYNCMLFKT